MSATFFRVNDDKKTVCKLARTALASAGLTEPKHLEAWLASAGDDLFEGRRVLWISRQDRPTEGQRSDLVGVDERGNLLVVELKRGEVGGEAVLQALTYAAEYARLSVDEIVHLFAEQSSKGGATGLVKPAKSAEQAQELLEKHVGENEVNQSQILVLVGEDFSASTLAICDYLNTASGDGTFSVECWKTGLFADAASTHQYFAIEQVLPPPSVREQVESKREAAKDKKHARNPQKKAFMSSLMDALRAAGVKVDRSKGESYRCWFESTAWPKDSWVSLSIHGTAPALYFPKTLELNLAPALTDAAVKDHDTEYKVVSFDSVSTTTVPPPAAFVDAVKRVVTAIAVPAG